MESKSTLYDFLVDNLKTFFFPEDWLELDLNFSKTELMALVVVERYGEVSMSQICDALNIPMSTATGIVDRMVRKGFLQRERSETDRRMVVVSMTEKGRGIFQHYKGMLTGYLEQIEAALTENELQLLYKIFMKVTAIIRREGEPDCGQSTDPIINRIEID
jgi:DNA-binding MarR family transcriptional regulator